MQIPENRCAGKSNRFLFFCVHLFCFLLFSFLPRIVQTFVRTQISVLRENILEIYQVFLSVLRCNITCPIKDKFHQRGIRGTLEYKQVLVMHNAYYYPGFKQYFSLWRLERSFLCFLQLIILRYICKEGILVEQFVPN